MTEMDDKDRVVGRLLGKPICPKCKQPIDYLEGYKEKRFNLEIIKGVLLQGAESFVPDSFHAECPECLDVVTDSWSRAERILKGE